MGDRPTAIFAHTKAQETKDQRRNKKRRDKGEVGERADAEKMGLLVHRPASLQRSPARLCRLYFPALHPVTQPRRPSSSARSSACAARVQRPRTGCGFGLRRLRSAVGWLRKEGYAGRRERKVGQRRMWTTAAFTAFFRKSRNPVWKSSGGDSGASTDELGSLATV